MNTGDLIAQMLIKTRVEYVFGVPGGQTAALYDAIYRRAGQIQHILFRDERNAVYAADGYARVTGRIGVCDATVGPGATKLPSGLAEALHSSIPVLAIISDIKREHEYLADFGAASQALDQIRMLEPTLKWSAKVPTAEAFPELFRSALRQATSGRPGPVALDIPDDVFTEQINRDDFDSGITIRDSSYPARRTAPDADSVALACYQLIEAERPVIIAGGGVLNSGAEEEIQRLAERLNAPVATTWSGKGSIAETHELSLGLLGAMGTAAAEHVVREADTVFLIGFKSGQNSTFSWTLPTPHQLVIHLDIDASEIGKAIQTEVGLVGDAKAGLQLMLEHIVPVERPAWRAQVDGIRAAWQRQLDQERSSDATPITPQRVLGEIQKQWSTGDTLVCDASFASGWGGTYLQLPEAGRYALFPRGIAGLGWGLPAAIGARFGRPDGHVLCLAGDGGFAYSTHELATIAKYQLPIISVVLNNSALSWIKWGQRLRWDEHYQSSDFPDVNFARVAEGFGVKGVRVTNPGELEGALSDAFASQSATVIDVITDEWQTPILAYREAVVVKEPARRGRVEPQKRMEAY